MLEACAFEEYKDPNEFYDDIKETTEDIMPNDLELAKNDKIYRFKLFEYLFLERCAI